MATTPAPAFVVRDSFTCDHTGGLVTYRKGDPVHPDDPELKAHPHLFEPVRYPHWSPPAAQPAVEQATAAPGEKRTTKG